MRDYDREDHSLPLLGILLLLLIAFIVFATDVLANGDSRPARGPVLGSEAFRPAASGPPQQFRPPPGATGTVLQPQPLKPLVDPEVDGLVGLVSFEQLRDIVQRTEKPEDRRMLQRAYDKLLLLERDRRTYAQSVNLLIEGCGKMIDALDGKRSAPPSK